MIKEEPKPGEEVREGTTITLTVSGGRGTVAVPAVEGQSREEAEQALTEAGFKVDVEEAFSESVPEGDVISQSPEGGTPGDQGPDRDDHGVARASRASRCRSSPA